jgi:hypothetical protein
MEVGKSAQYLTSVSQRQSLVMVPPHLSGERAKEDEMEAPKARAKIFIVEKNRWVCFYDRMIDSMIASIITVHLKRLKESFSSLSDVFTSW